MKLSTCPGLHPKYSGVFAGISVAELLAVTTAVESMVTQSASDEPGPNNRAARIGVFARS
jgi:hypothetical protein